MSESSESLEHDSLDNPERTTARGDIPVPLPWMAKTGGAPWLDGGIEEQVVRLRTLLEKIDEVDGYLERAIDWPDAGSSVSLSKPARKLAGSGILDKPNRDQVAITEAAKQWLDQGDVLLLVGLLHANVRFFGEILQVLSSRPGGMTHDELAQLASDDYGLSWKTLDPVRKRVGWLRSTGAATFEFDRNIKITDFGRSALATLTVTEPAEATRRETDGEQPHVSAPAPTAATQTLLDSLTPASLTERRATFGYIARIPNGDVVDSIRTLIAACVPEIAWQDFQDFCANKFQIKESSGVSTLYTLRSMGLLEQISVDRYAATEAAVGWLDDDNDVDLVRIVHSNIAYVGELIEATDHANKSPALADYMREAYGADLDAGAIRPRLHLLLGSGLLEQSGWAQYRPTSLGRAVAAELPMLTRVERAKPGQSIAEVTNTYFLGDTLAVELIDAASDGARPERLEKAVCDTLNYLGLHAEHLGGPGKTDVLATVGPGTATERRIIIDTKATSSGVVTDALVSFDALRDHLEKHKATSAALVGPSFGEGRVNKWAQEHQVALIDVYFLAEALRKEDQTPVGPTVLAQMLDFGSSGLRTIREAWAGAQYRKDLLRDVFEALANESRAPDEVTQGALKSEELYLLLRGVSDARPRTEDIKVALSLMDSPYLNAVTLREQRYAFSEPPHVVARRLRVLAGVFQGAADRQ